MARRKFKFVEMFINPETGAPFEDIGSPKLISPRNFPKFIGHQIAKINYVEKKIKDIKYTIKDGKSIKSGEEEITILVEKMGEKGGWIEQISNLSQDGDCWVSSKGIVCGNGFVGDDVILSSGEVGENAKVCGKAKIGGDVGIGGNAYVFGNASVSGNARIAVKGTARVCGKVEGRAVVEGNSYVGEKGTVSGSARVKGNAQVFGTVAGEATVQDAATVYGTVKGNAKVGYDAIILKSGLVEGNAEVDSGIVGGIVKGRAKISYGQPYVAKGGFLDDTVSVEGNTFVECPISDNAKMTGNGSAFEGGDLKGGEVSGNGTVRGISDKSNIRGGSIALGDVSGNAVLMDGARVGEDGSLSEGEVSGSANLGGSTSSGMRENSVVAPGASAQMELVGNEVFLEGDNREPEAISVICSVEA